MSAIAIVATLNGIVINIIMASRVMYGLARSGNLPTILGTLNPATQTPLVATALSVVIVLAFALAFPIAQLADISARITLIMFAIVNLALYAIKSREHTTPEGIFRCPRWVPLAGFVSCVVFILADLALLAS
jgi:amino acid transporter